MVTWTVIQSSQDGANFNEEFLTDLSTFTLQSVKNILEILRKLLGTLTQEEEVDRLGSMHDGNKKYVSKTVA